MERVEEPRREEEPAEVDLLAEEDEKRGRYSGAVTLVVVVVLTLVCLWFLWVFVEVWHVAHSDEAGPADAIAVFGAAEYNGHPSPVLNARLEHALDLYQQGLAPAVVTLGGGGGDPRFSEGGVGRSYMVEHGVPPADVIAETQSRDTEESAARLANIARERGLRTVIAVSDGTHLFRVQQICAADGLHVLVSPRDMGKSVTREEIAKRYIHEMIAYTLWRLHLH
jgi:uncharacterized SAM-binding protein YcdF (DUF218 family)